MAHKCDGCRYKGEHQEMMFRPVGVCNRGTNLVEAVQNYEAEKCPYKKTNGDRIRAMSDEELAESLEDWQDWGGGLTKELWLEWLKELAEVV